MGIRDLNDAPARRALLARFDAQMRIDPPPEPGVRHEHVAGIVRSRGAHNMIAAWTIASADAGTAVGSEAEFFRRNELPLEWKVYGHDRPASLTAALSQHGFVPDEPETLMVLALDARACDSMPLPPPDVAVVLVDDERRLGDLVGVTAQAFGSDEAWMLEALPPKIFGRGAFAAAYVAYADGSPVAGGRLECPPGRAFASLWGGATIPALRRRGLFSALVAIRAKRAWSAGFEYLTVDARESSRPILQRLGFVPLTTIVGWNLSVDEGRAARAETPAAITESERA